jgi:hypothetical protein
VRKGGSLVQNLRSRKTKTFLKNCDRCGETLFGIVGETGEAGNGDDVDCGSCASISFDRWRIKAGRRIGSGCGQRSGGCSW